MYLLIWWVDGEERRAELPDRKDVDFVIQFLEVGTRYEVYRREYSGYELLYKGSQETPLDML